MVMAEQRHEDEHDAAPERTCVGCRAHAERGELMRFVHVPEHAPPLVPDFANRLPGRGVWVHPRAACLKQSARGGFSRALRQRVDVGFADVSALARAQIERRIRGLLLAAQRRRAIALGTDAVRLAVAACATHLLLVAKDAAGRRAELVTLASERSVPVIELASKDELGHLTGKETLGFIAVLDSQIAREIADSARWLAGLSEDG